MGFSGGSAGKESACNVGDLGSIPGLGRCPGEGKGYPLQYSGLENSMDCIIFRTLCTLSDSMDCSPARLLCPWGFSRQEYCSGLPCPPPGDLLNTGIELGSPELQEESLLSEPQGKNATSFLLYTVMCIVFKRKRNQLCYIDCFHKGFLKT